MTPPAPPDPSRAPDANSLPRTAPLALGLAQEHCMPSCRAYHGVWQFVRLYGVLPGVEKSHDDLMGLLSQAARRGVRRLLVSGAADCGLLAYVIEAYRSEGRVAEVTVADLCPTPLELSRLYAAECGWNIRTIAGDIRHLDSGSFDLIIAHNFLNFFDAAGRQALAKAWCRALAPGGEIHVFASIRPGAAERSRRFADQDTIVRPALEARDASPHRDLIAENEYRELLAEFAATRVRHNLPDEATLRAPFAQARLEASVLRASVRQSAGIESDQPGSRFVLTARRR